MPKPEAARSPFAEEISLAGAPGNDSYHHQAALLRALWERRRFLGRAAAAGFLVSAAVALCIPNSFTATTQLMPPDPQSGAGLAMMAAMAGKAGGGLGMAAGDLLGLKSSGALFIGILRSQTCEDRLVTQFALKTVYGRRLAVDARARLEENTAIAEDRKSGILSVRVTDRSAERAAALAGAYVDQLNTLVSGLSTTSAHRERVFLEGRLEVAKRDLDAAATDLAQFSSQNGTLDIQEEGKAMLDAASNIEGQRISVESQLEGLRQIYSDENPRVRALKARAEELRDQLAKLGGTETETGGVARRPFSALAVPAAAPEKTALPFPTIRSLPLLGARYADYYRRAKIQETVYELLTEQYELAKVQEAKETPSVKILDPATIPERKSFPPRWEYTFLGTFLAAASAAGWVLASFGWREFDPADPRRILLQEVAGTLKLHAPWALQNGSSPVRALVGMCNRFRRRAPAGGRSSL